MIEKEDECSNVEASDVYWELASFAEIGKDLVV